MTPIESLDAQSSLKAKGFRRSDNDHRYFHYFRGEKKTRFFVKISHGTREMKPREIRASAQVCSMTGSDMWRVLGCEHDQDWVARHFADPTF